LFYVIDKYFNVGGKYLGEP